ncbi:MAG TPA: D-alanine--D-alanine ligase family protein [Thermoleophilaceae bacterium]|nr:D-alanine--D-alanine ligase family protein [Thermoleophilaceae bacterium]
MKVAVLAGGRSSEHEVSLASGDAVREGLEEAGHEPLDVHISREGRWTCDGRAVALDPAGGLLGVDAVFPALHGPFGEDGTVQGLLELLDVPYVGAGVMASAVAMDKALFKDLMAAHGVPQVDYAVVREGEDPRLSFPMPVFVKPARLGSSVGISRASSSVELRESLGNAFKHDPLVLVERMATGLEVECSVLGNRSPEASVPGEIVVKKGDWYDYESKYTDGGMELVVPARIADDVREQVRRLAVRAFELVGCSGMARVDFFVEEGQVLVNELNTIPGFTSTSVYAKLFEASGVPYPQLLDRLVKLAVERHEEERRYRF